jgi:hypothetical protein
MRFAARQAFAAVLLLFSSIATWAQQATFDSGSGVLTLPAVKVGSATYTNVLLNLINPANYTFRLAAATAQIPAGPADITFDAGTGIVTIPSVAVGSTAYSVTLQLTDNSTYTFALGTATLIPPTTWTLSQIQANVFDPYCSFCHGVSMADANTTYAYFVNQPSSEQTLLLLIKPGDPDHSYLIRKMEGTSISGKIMPPNGKLDQATINQIRNWITSGAPNN